MKLPAPNRRVLFGGAFAILSGLLAVVLAQRWVTQQRAMLNVERRRLVQDREKLKAEMPSFVEVVTASKDLPEGLVLESSHLKTALVPDKFVQPYAARAFKEVVGKVTLVPMAEGEELLVNKVRPPEEMAARGSTLSSMMPQGKRAVTIAVDTLTGVGGFVRRGDIVDILWTLKLPAAGQGEGQVVTLTVFKDVPVLAIGPEVSGRSAESRGQKTEAGLQQYLVTLALSPQETSFLLFAREQGRIQLSLRPKSEGGTKVTIAPANINTLLEAQLGIKPSAEAPSPPTSPSSRAPREVEVYKGLKRGVVSLSGGEE
ncbi:MAG: Flp pilus assembly protein CpaB [Candidatus Omnitrophica bacterium]|nr:Flp pilus assembly protein CpaB [Candidatus Omnitrophota bacterium]